MNKISNEQMIEIMEAEWSSRRMARFRAACPESARMYDDAERDMQLILTALQAAFTSPNGAMAHQYASIVAKDVVNVAIAWAAARDAYVRFCDKDPGF